MLLEKLLKRWDNTSSNASIGLSRWLSVSLLLGPLRVCYGSFPTHNEIESLFCLFVLVGWFIVVMLFCIETVSIFLPPFGMWPVPNTSPSSLSFPLSQETLVGLEAKQSESLSELLTLREALESSRLEGELLKQERVEVAAALARVCGSPLFLQRCVPKKGAGIPSLLLGSLPPNMPSASKFNEFFEV